MAMTRLKHSTNGSQIRRSCPYFVLRETDGGRQKAELSPLVRHWISHTRTTDPECVQESTIRDLVDLVEEKLLVVPIKNVDRPDNILQGGWLLRNRARLSILVTRIMLDIVQ